MEARGRGCASGKRLRTLLLSNADLIPRPGEGGPSVTDEGSW